MMALLKIRIGKVFTQMILNKQLLKNLHRVYASLPKFLVLLVIFLTVACSDWNKNNSLSSIKLELWYEQHALGCGQSLDSDNLQWGIEQLAFFLSDIKLVQNDQEQPLVLSSNDWQSANIALLRFADSACSNQKQQDDELDEDYPAALAFHSLQFTAPVQLDKNTQLRFNLGVPFEINHLNPLSQPSPLNMPSMFWSWRGGHKFLRLDMQSDNDAWNFHLGSTGCTSASVMRSPQSRCVDPNTLQFNLARQQQGERLIVHLDRLLQGIELSRQTSCLMQPDRPSCLLLMANLADNKVFEWR